MVITWTYRILISCPGDVYDGFMPIIQKAVAEYSDYIGNSLMQKHFEQMYGHRIAIEVLFWRENSHPIFLTAASGQDIINEQLVGNTDGTIGLFYTRLGTPTDQYESGTVEEVELSLAQGKHVAIIPIVDRMIPIELLGDGHNYAKMKQYINKIRSERRGLIIDCYPEKLQDVLMDQFNEIIGQVEKEEKYKTISLT